MFREIPEYSRFVATLFILRVLCHCLHPTIWLKDNETLMRWWATDTDIYQYDNTQLTIFWTGGLSTLCSLLTCWLCWLSQVTDNYWGVRIQTKMTDISFLKTEPKWLQNSKTQVSAVWFSKNWIRRFGDGFSHRLIHNSKTWQSCICFSATVSWTTDDRC